MKERPILFSGEMVRAILDGRKTQTRRIMKLQPSMSPALRFDAEWGVVAEWPGESEFDGYDCHCPYGVAGDRLWVRESHAWADVMIDNVEREDAVCVAYKADKTILRHEGTPPLDCDTYAINFEHKSLRWRPSIHMPRWASRVALKIVNVRVERVQEISEADAKAEAAPPFDSLDARGRRIVFAPIRDFHHLWDSIHGKGAWERNDWVWVIEFKRV